MHKRFFFTASVFILALTLNGCLIRTYTVRKERVDQEIPGNRGYFAGKSAAAEKQPVKTREIIVTEIELRSPIKFGKPEAKPAKPEAPPVSGNQGYLTGKPQQPAPVSPAALKQTPASATRPTTAEQAPKFIQYKVEKDDTLQKISKKFYDNYSRWTVIYDANKDKLKSPNAIRPGQILDIPQE